MCIRDRKLYDYIKENPDVMAAPVDYTNDVQVIAKLDNFISINNAVDMDLFGQVNACLLYTSPRFRWMLALSSMLTSSSAS